MASCETKSGSEDGSAVAGFGGVIAAKGEMVEEGGSLRGEEALSSVRLCQERMWASCVDHNTVFDLKYWLRRVLRRGQRHSWIFHLFGGG
jgi:hypothetical protein